VRLLACSGIVGGLALATACGKSPGASATAADSGGDASATGDADVDGGVPEAPRPPSTLVLRDIVGLSSHPRLGTDPTSTSERAFEWARMTELGIHRMRTDFTWATIEPQRGTFDYSQVDSLVDDATAHGMDLLAVLDYGVTWATTAPSANDGYPPDHPADFGAFAAAVAKRYAAHVSDYEVWNEPNNGLRFWQPTLNGDPAAYGALLLEALKDLRAAQPAAHVAYAGVVYNDLMPGPVFVDQSLRDTAGLAGALDTFGMHAYQTYPPTAGPESAVGHEVPLMDKVATMSGVLAEDGAHAVPIWITEIGWPVTAEDPLAQQARYTVRACVLGALAGADRVFLYTLLDGPNPMAFPPEDAFGLMTYSDFSTDAGAPQPKPAFVAVKALMAAVGDFAVQKRLSAQPADVYLVQLVGAGNLAWIAWRATDGAPMVNVTVPASGNVLVTSVDGSTQTGAATASGFALSVGPDPVVVTGR